MTNTGLHRFSRIWHRIRVLDGDTALLLGGFEPTEDYERGVYFAFLARGGEVLHIAQGLKVRTTRRTAHAESGYGVPASVELELDDGRLRLQGRVVRRRLIGEFDVLQQLNPVFQIIVRTFFANPWIFRNRSNVEVTWSLDGGAPQALNAAGMHEVIYVND